MLTRMHGRPGPWLALTMAVGLHTAGLAAPLCFGVVDIKPLGLRAADGRVEGDTLPVIAALARHAGLVFEPRLLPLARGLRELSQRRCDVFIALPLAVPDPAVRVLGPVAYGEVVLMPRVGVQPPKDGNWQGARIVSLVGGVAWGPGVAIGPVERVQVVSLPAMVAMLKAGRADAAVGLRFTLEYALSQAGHQPQDFGTMQSLGKLPMLLYAGAQVDDATAQLLRAAAQAVLAAGEGDAMVRPR